MLKAVEKAVDMLGYPAKDKVTGCEGVITSASYDLYGCVQLVLTQKVDKDGRRDNGQWYDIARLKITGKRVMEPVLPREQDTPGPAFKPLQ